MLTLSENARKRGLVLAMGGLGGLVMLDETILGVSLPTMRSELGVSATTAHWILNSYMLAFTCLAAVGGKAIDLFDLRPALIVSCSVFALASLLAGFSDSGAMLICLRVIQGLCSAIIFPITLAATTLTFDKEERGKAIGILVSMATIFLAAGPLLGGVLTDFLSWRWVFWINIPVVAGGGVLACLLWKKPRREFVRPEIDKVGLVLLLIGMTALIFGLMEGPEYGWAAPAIIGSLIAGLAGCAAFVAFEAKKANPLIDVRLFRLQPFSASVLAVLLTQMCKIVVAIFIPHFLQREMGFSALWAGIGTVVAVFPYPFVAPHAGKLADKIGSRKPLLTALLILAAANAAVGGLMFLKNYWALAPALLVWGIVLPYGMISPGRISMNTVSSEKQGEVSGLLIAARLVGSTVGVTLGSVLLGVGAGTSSIFWVLTVLLLACWVYCVITVREET